MTVLTDGTPVSLSEAAEKKILLLSKGLSISEDLKAQIAREGYWLGFPHFWIGDVNVAVADTPHARSSPYELKRTEEGYVIFENGHPFTPVELYKRPKFADIGLGFEAKTPDMAFSQSFQPVLQPLCYNHIGIWAGLSCIYFKKGKGCKFCVLGGISDWDESMMFGDNPEWIAKMCDTMEMACQEIGPGLSSVGLFVDSGTWPGKDKGMRVYIKILEAIKERLGELPPFKHITACIEPPLEDEWLHRAAEAGFTGMLADLEVFDGATRRRIMPNAKGYRSVEEYDRVLAKALEVFGRGEGLDHPPIQTLVLAGIEDDESLLAGVEHLAERGICPLIVPFFPAAGTDLEQEGLRSPSAERMKGINLKAAEILRKYDLTPENLGICSLAEVMGKEGEPLLNY